MEFKKPRKEIRRKTPSLEEKITAAENNEDEEKRNKNLFYAGKEAIESSNFELAKSAIEKISKSKEGRNLQKRLEEELARMPKEAEVPKIVLPEKEPKELSEAEVVESSQVETSEVAPVSNVDQINVDGIISYKGTDYKVTETPSEKNKNRYILVHPTGKPIYKLTTEQLKNIIDESTEKVYTPETTQIENTVIAQPKTAAKSLEDSQNFIENELKEMKEGLLAYTERNDAEMVEYLNGQIKLLESSPIKYFMKEIADYRVKMRESLQSDSAWSETEKQERVDILVDIKNLESILNALKKSEGTPKNTEKTPVEVNSVDMAEQKEEEKDGTIKTSNGREFYKNGKLVGKETDYSNCTLCYNEKGILWRTEFKDGTVDLCDEKERVYSRIFADGSSEKFDPESGNSLGRFDPKGEKMSATKKSHTEITPTKEEVLATLDEVTKKRQAEIAESEAIKAKILENAPTPLSTLVVSKETPPAEIKPTKEELIANLKEKIVRAQKIIEENEKEEKVLLAKLSEIRERNKKNPNQETLEGKDLESIPTIEGKKEFLERKRKESINNIEDIKHEINFSTGQLTAGYELQRTMAKKDLEEIAASPLEYYKKMVNFYKQKPESYYRNEAKYQEIVDQINGINARYDELLANLLN
jgi:hypothetical protein